MRSLSILALFVLGTPILVSQVVRAQEDQILLARCEASCWNLQPPNRQRCIQECTVKMGHKPGTCPAEGPPLFLGCLQECTEDSSCPSTHKCCPHSCGVSCKPPLGLDKVPGLPPIPQNVTIIEKKKSKSPLIQWLPKPLPEIPIVLYVVEERHLTAAQWRETGAGEWAHLKKVTASSRAPSLRATSFKPGTWYQVRVAAVNANGTRGFSQPSKPFRLSIPPKAPGPPQNLTFVLGAQKNGTVAGLLSWSPPVSDLPIIRYTVTWSRRVAVPNAKPNEGSEIVNKKIIGHDKTNFRLRKLHPNSQYRMQVEAHAQYGRQQLLSQKATILVNTSTVATVQVFPNKNGTNRHLSVRMTKLAPRNGKLFTKVVWKGRANTKYGVTWEASCGNKEVRSVTTQMNEVEITGLHYDCSYSVHVKERGNGKRRRSGKINFITSSCNSIHPPSC